MVFFLFFYSIFNIQKKLGIMVIFNRSYRRKGRQVSWRSFWQHFVQIYRDAHIMASSFNDSSPLLWQNFPNTKSAYYYVLWCRVRTTALFRSDVSVNLPSCKVDWLQFIIGSLICFDNGTGIWMVQWKHGCLCCHSAYSYRVGFQQCTKISNSRSDISQAK